ncbi:hypothetical protein BGLA2_2590010 [Burkholderia gladioli]|nr:hypothetical protein BGLA2_2590010 [Burkholderia gladioli]
MLDCPAGAMHAQCQNKQQRPETTRWRLPESNQ